jgi:DNA processing protein
MMNEKELLYLLSLQKVKGIGTINAKKLISHLGSAEAVFKEKKSVLQKINGIGLNIIKDLYNPQVLKNAEKELDYLLQNKVKYTVFYDDDYPERLQHCVDAPLLMFYDGTIIYDKHPIISIVGTRNMTGYGRHFLEKLIDGIKEYNPIIVSGFAYGVDITAHKIAFEHQLQTIAVLANGLDTMYPKTHQKYVHKVLKNGGFYTEYWHDEEPLREFFLRRNRIIAGLSEATIIIESASRGGSLVTAQIANSYNRDVFAVPGRVSDTYSQGCNNLIRTNQAALLNSAKDLVYFLNWDQKKSVKKVIQRQLFINLIGDEKIIYEYLLEKGKTGLDTISLDCKIPIYKISGILLNLELQGIIRPLPGKQFEAI